MVRIPPGPCNETVSNSETKGRIELCSLPAFSVPELLAHEDDRRPPFLRLSPINELFGDR